MFTCAVSGSSSRRRPAPDTRATTARDSPIAKARLDQYLSYLPVPNLQLNLSGDEYRTEYDLPVHTTTGTSVRFDVQWNYGAWLTSGYAGWRTYRDTLQPTESVLEAGLRVRRTWTKLDLNFAAGDAGSQARRASTR